MGRAAIIEPELTVSPQIQIDDDALRAFCRRNHIRELAFFGSVLREDFGPGSDVDVLVDFEEGHTPGLDFISMRSELSALLGNRRVDMVTKRALHPLLRDRILRTSEIRYAA